MSIRLVRALVLHFADLAGYDGHLLVTFDRRRFDRACKRYRLDPADDEDYGESIVDPSPPRVPLIWLNRSANASVLRLARTCAHEALHVARPTLPHGPVFDRSVGKLLRGREP